MEKPADCICWVAKRGSIRGMKGVYGQFFSLADLKFAWLTYLPPKAIPPSTCLAASALRQATQCAFEWDGTR